MNTPLKSLLVGCAMLGMTPLPQAQESTPEFDPTGEHNDLPKLIRVQVEFIDVSHEQLTDLMFGEHPSANDGQLRKKVGELVAKGQASIIETMLSVGKSGMKATTASNEEFIYATEYEPPQLPGTFNGSEARTTPRDAATGPTPSAWETRNLGSTLEIEPALSDDQRIIDLRFVPELVYHVGDQVWAEWKDEHGRADIKMPLFYVIRLNTAITTVAGEYLLAAAVSPKDKDGFPDFSRKVMIFVKCDVLTVGR
ncbi:MAG: hypothetical protein NTW21_07260 [Verrucomicrobia bacterium]|nr:hypothetical protein [Verrucomicrobiota bacterium]